MVIFGVALVLLILFEMRMSQLDCEAAKQSREKMVVERDPCHTCLRWPECNGVDRDTCNLIRAYREG